MLVNEIILRFGDAQVFLLPDASCGLWQIRKIQIFLHGLCSLPPIESFHLKYYILEFLLLVSCSKRKCLHSLNTRRGFQFSSSSIVLLRINMTTDCLKQQFSRMKYNLHAKYHPGKTFVVKDAQFLKEAEMFGLEKQTILNCI